MLPAKNLSITAKPSVVGPDSSPTSVSSSGEQRPPLDQLSSSANSASLGAPFYDSERRWRLIHPGLLREGTTCDRPCPRGDWPPLHPPGRGSMLGVRR